MVPEQVYAIIRRQPAGCEKYNAEADAFIERYESLRFEDVHADILEMLPLCPARILDVGAGSGRDAAALARLGYEVVAVEPSTAMQQRAQALHQQKNIVWLDDALPDLCVVKNRRAKFAFILLSAVWMHVPPSERPHAFASLVSLLDENGCLAMSLRMGPPDTEREIYPVNPGEVVELGAMHHLDVLKVLPENDRLGRSEIAWTTVVMQRPREDCGGGTHENV